MRKELTMLGAIAALALGSLFGAHAHAAAGFGTVVEPASGSYNGVVCKTWIDGSGSYPFDNDHFRVCWSTPNGPRATSVGNTIKNWGFSKPQMLQSQNVYFYYFVDRAAMNSFMDGKFPTPVSQEAQYFKSTTARCGNTGWNPNSGRIISSIFEICTYTAAGLPSSAQNENLQKTTLHEGSHAFDFAWKKSQGGILPTRFGPSESKAFKNLVLLDFAKITPCNWSAPGCTPQKSAMTAAQQISYVCTYFQILSPSNLERDLLTPNDSVCANSNTVNPPYKTGSVPKAPFDIAKTRIPYFMNTLPPGVSGSPDFQEIFVERLSMFKLSGAILPVTDQILSTNSFGCVFWAIRAFHLTNNPPPLSGPDSLSAHGCGPDPASMDEWKNPQ